jgi:ubiquinone biosynthesis protein COQ4
MGNESLIDPWFLGRFGASATDFYGYGVHQLFNDWWASAPDHAITTYVRAIESHPDQGPLAASGWLAPPVSLSRLKACADGTLGATLAEFIVADDLVVGLAQGYRDYHDGLAASGVLDRMPPVLAYKVLRGYQTHDLHHVLTGYPATPFGELALQAFQLAQNNFPYAAMWIAVVTAHMALVDPRMTVPAMDAITHGWLAGRGARSIQFIAFETRLDANLDDLRAEYRIRPADPALFVTPEADTPLRLQ